eukprot:tig00000981_g5883.t1
MSYSGGSGPGSRNDLSDVFSSQSSQAFEPEAFDSISASKLLNDRWAATVSQLTDPNCSDADKPEVYKSQDKAWGAGKSPLTLTPINFVEALKKSMEATRAGPQ